MLIRLEVHGFKNLVAFDAQFGPFTCIGGENGVGKSNIFDAIQFLSLTAQGTLSDAAHQIRSTGDDNSGEVGNLFTLGLADRHMRFAAELIVPLEATDDFGVTVRPSITFVKYELVIGVDEASSTSRFDRLVVESESLTPIKVAQAGQLLRFPHSKTDFRQAVAVGKRTGGPFIDIDAVNERISVHQDGGKTGRPKRALPIRAGTTVVSTVNSADAPTILAVRRELESWHRLALEPSALRRPDRFADDLHMAADGRHLAATLHRIATSGLVGSPADVCARVANRLSGLAGVDIRDVRVDIDEARQLMSVIVVDGLKQEFPARSLSEGTLRYLALCVLLEDPASTGLITMEEPENGIHPSNLSEMVELVRALAVDPTYPPGPGNPMRQVIVNTHSTGVVELMRDDEILLAEAVVVDTAAGAVQGLEVKGMNGSWRTNEKVRGVSRIDLLPYLSHQPGAQQRLFDVA